MKYAHLINGKDPAVKPAFWEEKWISEVLSELELAKLSPQDRAIVQMPLVKEATIKEAEKLRLQDAKARAEKKGMEKGMEEKNTVAIRNMTKKGFNIEIIAGVLEISTEYVLGIQKQLIKESEIMQLLNAGKMGETEIAKQLTVSPILVAIVKKELLARNGKN